MQDGNHAQAIGELEQAMALTPGLGRVKADLGYAYAVSGKGEKAREILNEFLKLFGDFSIASVGYAIKSAEF